jgi:hypothetical protein
MGNDYLNNQVFLLLCNFQLNFALKAYVGLITL